MSKKNEDVFTIKFDERFPKHKQAIAILNGVGRKKSFIIAEALDLYIKKSGLFDEVIIPKVKPSKRVPVLENFDIRQDAPVQKETAYEQETEIKEISSPQEDIILNESGEDNFNISGYEEASDSEITSEDVSSIMEAIQGFDSFE